MHVLAVILPVDTVLFIPQKQVFQRFNRTLFIVVIQGVTHSVAVGFQTVMF